MEYRILGPLEVLLEGRQIALGAAQPRAVLAVLLLHANEVVSVDRLVDELWGESPPPTATKTVQLYVSQLRKAFGPNADVIETRAPGYVIHAEPEQIDVGRFERLAAEARERAMAGDAEAAAGLFRQSLALWRGRVLAGLTFESLARIEVEQLEDKRVAARMDEIDCALVLGEAEQVVGELETLVAQHPLLERARGQLMLALYRSGRQAEALAAYRQTRGVLVDELGIEPGRSLRELERAILRQDPSLDQPPLAPGGGRDAGSASSSGARPSSRSFAPASRPQSPAGAGCSCWSASRASARAASRTR